MLKYRSAGYGMYYAGMIGKLIDRIADKKPDNYERTNHYRQTNPNRYY